MAETIISVGCFRFRLLAIFWRRVAINRERLHPAGKFVLFIWKDGVGQASRLSQTKKNSCLNSFNRQPTIAPLVVDLGEDGDRRDACPPAETQRIAAVLLWVPV